MLSPSVAAQAISRRPLAAETLVQSPKIHVSYVVEKVEVGQVFLRVAPDSRSLPIHNFYEPEGQVDEAGKP
jgi:hypothetical protein